MPIGLVTWSSEVADSGGAASSPQHDACVSPSRLLTSDRSRVKVTWAARHLLLRGAKGKKPVCFSLASQSPRAGGRFS